MTISRVVQGSLVIAIALALAGCGHKLVAAKGETAINIYPDEQTYQRVSSMQHQGGPVGMLGGLGQDLLAKKVDPNTPVRIISKDDNGAQIEVTDGPNKGVQGFVGKENLD